MVDKKYSLPGSFVERKVDQRNKASNKINKYYQKFYIM